MRLTNLNSDLHIGLLPNMDMRKWYTQYLNIYQYNDVIMGAMTSQIASHAIVYSTFYSRRRSKKTSKKHITGQHKGPVTRKMCPFDDVIIANIHQCIYYLIGDEDSRRYFLFVACICLVICMVRWQLLTACIWSYLCPRFCQTNISQRVFVYQQNKYKMAPGLGTSFVNLRQYDGNILWLRMSTIVSPESYEIWKENLPFFGTHNPVYWDK